jgi:hypothetical protein
LEEKGDVVMKRFRNKLVGLIHAVDRYPLTMLFLVAVATVNVVSIQNETEDYSKYLFAFIVGAFLSAVGQQIYERFCTKASERFLLMGGTVLLAAGYFLAVRNAPVFSTEIYIKTGVALFALMMAFIWVPSIKSKVMLHESFMSAFKAFFITVLFSAVLAGGISAILFAIDQLLFPIPYKVNAHALNIIFSLFSPIFFLSFTPPFPGKKDAGQAEDDFNMQWKKVQKAGSVPKMLEVLISYVIIPLTAVYTVILLAYVLFNIRGAFWTNNLLEPMLVSYAVVVIIVYILASSVDNAFANLFRKIFPKILIPIVLFQTIASILKISEAGVTHGRYYAIMFGVFAVISGVIFSFFPVRKNGWIAAVLIIFSAVSIIPPVDAFTVSRVNQVNLLEDTLSDHNMFEDGNIVPNPDIPVKDKKTITRTVRYLDEMKYIQKIGWLPKNIFYGDRFKQTFGFDEVYDDTDGGAPSQFAHLDWERSPVMNVENYDRMVHLTLQHPPEAGKEPISMKINGKQYTLEQEHDGDSFGIRLLDHKGHEWMYVNAKEALDNVIGESTLTVEKATATHENDKVRMDILINSVDYYGRQYYADLFIFLKIK